MDTAESVNWNKVGSLSILQSEDINRLKDLSQDRENIASRFQTAPQRNAESLLTLIARVEEDRLAVLQLIQAILSVPKNAVVFHDLNRDPYEPFVGILSRPDFRAASRSAQIIAALLTKAPGGRAPERLVEQVILWAHKNLSGSENSTNNNATGNNEQIEAALGVIQILLREDSFRLLYSSRDGIARLHNVLRNSNKNNFEVMYRTIYSFWLLAYNSEIADSMFPQNLIFTLAEILKNVTKEKVVRITLALFRNLLDHGKNNQHMIESGALKIITTLLQNKKWGDEDIVEDLQLLSTTLEKNMALMSSFDHYKKEVLSRSLEWTPMHKRESFWRENAHHFEENNFAIINALVEILQDPSSSNLCLAVACNDLGEFVRFHPRGRSILGNANYAGKTSIMKLMVHQDPEVQKQALLAVQKLMVTNWEYLSK